MGRAVLEDQADRSRADGRHDADILLQSRTQPQVTAIPQQHAGTVLYYADSKPNEQYDTFSVGVTPDDSALVPQGKKCLYINEKDGRADYLCSLRKGDRVVFFESGRGRSGPYYSLLKTNSQGGFAIEDPVVDEILGPKPDEAVRHPEHGYATSNAPQQPTPADMWEQFSAWAVQEASRWSTLYNNIETKLPNADPRAIGAGASTLYIQWNRR